MDTQNVATPAPVTCRKYVKDEKATFFVNLKGQVNEFVNSSMDEHKACLQNTMNKICGMFKKVEAKEVEPLQAAALESPAA